MPAPNSARSGPEKGWGGATDGATPRLRRTAAGGGDALRPAGDGPPPGPDESPAAAAATAAASAAAPHPVCSRQAPAPLRLSAGARGGAQVCFRRAPAISFLRGCTVSAFFPYLPPLLTRRRAEDPTLLLLDTILSALGPASRPTPSMSSNPVLPPNASRLAQTQQLSASPPPFPFFALRAFQILTPAPAPAPGTDAPLRWQRPSSPSSGTKPRPARTSSSTPTGSFA